MIFCQTGVDVSHNGFHTAGVSVECIIVKGEKFRRNGLIGKLQAEIAAVFGVCQIAPAHITWVIGIRGQEFQISSALTGEVAGAVCNAAGNTDKVIRHWDICIQKRIAHAAGEDGSKGTAFHDQTAFH